MYFSASPTLIFPRDKLRQQRIVHVPAGTVQCFPGHQLFGHNPFAHLGSRHLRANRIRLEGWKRERLKIRDRHGVRLFLFVLRCLTWSSIQSFSSTGAISGLPFLAKRSCSTSAVKF